MKMHRNVEQFLKDKVNEIPEKILTAYFKSMKAKYGPTGCWSLEENDMIHDPIRKLAYCAAYTYKKGKPTDNSVLFLAKIEEINHTLNKLNKIEKQKDALKDKSYSAYRDARELFGIPHEEEFRISDRYMKG